MIAIKFKINFLIKTKSLIGLYNLLTYKILLIFFGFSIIALPAYREIKEIQKKGYNSAKNNSN